MLHLPFVFRIFILSLQPTSGIPPYAVSQSIVETFLGSHRCHKSAKKVFLLDREYPLAILKKSSIGAFLEILSKIMRYLFVTVYPKKMCLL